MNPPIDKEEEVEKLVGLLIVDYEQTLKVVDGFVRVSSSIRALATTVWVGLLAASIQTEQAELSFLAAGAVVVFAFLDAYHGWLYKQASERAYDIEKLLNQYYKYLYRGDRDDRLQELRKDLRNHRFGQLSHIPKLSKAFYWKARPTFFYKGLYIAFLVTAVVLGMVVGNGANGNSKAEPLTPPSHDGHHSHPRTSAADTAPGR